MEPARIVRALTGLTEYKVVSLVRALNGLYSFMTLEERQAAEVVLAYIDRQKPTLAELASAGDIGHKALAALAADARAPVATTLLTLAAVKYPLAELLGVEVE